MINKELIDRRFMQLESRIATLEFMLSRQTTAAEFKTELEKTKEILEDLKMIVERGISPLRNG